MIRTTCLLASALVFGACSSIQQAPHETHDPHVRQPLLDSVKALEGTWESKSSDGKVQVCEFKVTAAGSAVREIMFPGTPHEMTNVYCLDGNGLSMTHYCAMGNQPHLRATAREGNMLEFGVQSVSDMEAPDEMYMGQLTLEFVDADHVTEHWRSYVKGAEQKGKGVDIALARRK